MQESENKSVISATNLSIGYGSKFVQRNLDFEIQKESVFIIMGGSGCGKSTLLRTLIGLNPPLKGSVFYAGENFWEMQKIERNEQLKKIGVLFQQGALWSSRTLEENITMPLALYNNGLYSQKDMKEIASLKLALVGLAGFEDYYPSEISGGMRKRAGLARALALDPEIVFFDEPSAGLDPISATLLDRLILELRDSLGMTVAVVTHELASIFAIGTDSIFLDAETKTQLAKGNPHELLKHGPDTVRFFLARGEEK